jgi:UDP-glucose 4-epimerase
MKNKILLIGGAGFIGSALVRCFLKEDIYEVYILESRNANLYRIQSVINKITLLEGDVKTPSSLSQILIDNKIDIVIHLVSTLIPGSSLTHFHKEMNDIIMPIMYLMEICAQNDIKFVYFSSGGTVYGNGECNLHNELDKKEPISYYGLSKSMAEEMIEFEHRHLNLTYLIVRPSNPYGEGQNIYGKQGLIAVSIGKILNKDAIEIWGDGNSVRDYIYIDDLAYAVHQLLSNNVFNKTINIGSGIGYSVNQIIKILSDVMKVDIKINYLPIRGVDVDSLILDNSNLRGLIKFNPIDVEEGIRLFVNNVSKKSI